MPRKNIQRYHTYLSWREMLRRCYQSGNKSYAHYGARGIRVCRRWLDLRNFVADMGMKPPGLTIERIDNNKGYSPKNCKWATRQEQARNRSNNHFIAHGGKTLCITDWAKELGITQSAINHRISSGWTEIEAISIGRTKP